MLAAVSHDLSGQGASRVQSITQRRESMHGMGIKQQLPLCQVVSHAHGAAAETAERTP